MKNRCKIITKSLKIRNINESQIFLELENWHKNYFKPYFCLPDIFLAEKLHIRAFTASRKTSYKFSQASSFEQKIRLRGLSPELGVACRFATLHAEFTRLRKLHFSKSSRFWATLSWTVDCVIYVFDLCEDLKSLCVLLHKHKPGWINAVWCLQSGTVAALQS